MPMVFLHSYSQAREGRPQFAQDFYVLSESQLTNYSMASLQDGEDAFSGVVGLKPHVGMVDRGSCRHVTFPPMRSF